MSGVERKRMNMMNRWIVMTAVAMLAACGGTATPATGSGTTTTSGSGGTGGSGGAPGVEEDVDCGAMLSNYPPPPAPTIGTRVDLSFPDGTRLLSVSTEVIAATDHGKLPATLPSLQMAVAPAPTPSMLTVTEFAYDPSATLAAYQSPHPLTFTLANGGLVMDTKANAYAALAVLEGGEGSKSGTLFFGFTCRVVRP